MARKSELSQRVPKAPPSDRDGNHIHNEILRALPRKESELVFSQLELVRLKHAQVLHEVGDTLKSAYFCNSGLVSILSVFPDGKSVEVGLVGKEGFIGLPRSRWHGVCPAFAPAIPGSRAEKRCPRGGGHQQPSPSALQLHAAHCRLLLRHLHGRDLRKPL